MAPTPAGISISTGTYRLTSTHSDAQVNSVTCASRITLDITPATPLASLTLRANGEDTFESFIQVPSGFAKFDGAGRLRQDIGVRAASLEVLKHTLSDGSAPSVVGTLSCEYEKE